MGSIVGIMMLPVFYDDRGDFLEKGIFNFAVFHFSVRLLF